MSDVDRQMREYTNIPHLSQSCLENNLKALAFRSPELYEWIQDLPGKDAPLLQVTTSGHPNLVLKERQDLLLHSAIDPPKEAEEEVLRLQCDQNQPILCLGVGLGYYLEALLKKNNPCQPVIAYERNPWLLHLTLMRTDFRRDILAGRLRFLSPSEILRYRPEDRQGLFLWLHPVLGSIYDWEKALFARQQASSSSYRRAMVISGGLFVLDVSEALQERGLEVHGYDPLSKDQKQVVEDIISLAPDLILSVNYRHGLPEISSTLGIPVLVWEIDPTIERLVPQRTSTPHTYIYTYRKSNVARFREAGFEHVEYLPLAANPRRRYPKDLNDEDFAKYGADVSFAGSSMTEQAEVLGQLFAQMTKGKGFPANPNSPVHDYTSLWQLALTNQLHNPDRYVVEDVFNQHLPLGSWVIGNGQNRLVDLVACTAETAASHRRAQALSTLAQLRNGATVRVWGDDGWCRLLPETIDYSGPVGHFHELTAVYNASRVNLDINRIYQRDIATMRVFDVMACRGFLLADYSDDLGELFELESEVIAYRSLAEIPSLVKHFLNHPSEREQVAIAGYERVLKEHTIQMRVESMLNNLP